MRSLVLNSTYDEEVDAGYIAFDEIAPGEAARNIVVRDRDLGSLVILDVDANGKLLGIELLDVSTLVARPRFTSL